MPVIPINSDYSNINQFIDSLFDTDVRTLNSIRRAIQGGGLTMAFSDQNEKIKAVWLAAWRAFNNLPYDEKNFSHCPESDQYLIRFLSRFIYDNNLSMFVPELKYLELDNQSGCPIYQLQGYQQYAFKEGGQVRIQTTESFFDLLLPGAHFVFIQAAEDLPPGVTVESYYQMFKSNADLAPYRRHDPGNSHYTSVLNICGYYAPDIKGNSAPNPCPLLVAYLVGPTVSEITCDPSVYSTFMQLEGWESPYSRHNTDYDTYKKTLWNISTFGACAYSEKRGTTVFLAPGQWQPRTNPDTIMPPYAGAETAQPWLNKNLVRLAAASE
jgi:hypothetical protein